MSDIGCVSCVEGANAYITLGETEACAECGARIICKSDSNGGRELKVNNNIGARVGDQVEIEEPGSMLLKISALQYGLPFTGFLTGVFTCYFFKPVFPGVADELLLFASGFLGVLGGGWISWLMARRLAGNISFRFSINRIISYGTISTGQQVN